MSKIALDSSIAFTKAVEENLTVEVPDEYTLQLDIDKPNFSYNYGDPDNEDFVKRIHSLDANFGIAHKSEYGGGYDIRETKSRNGNTHIYIRMKEPLTPTEKILLQAALGSDGMRELLSFKRLKSGDPVPTLLFEKKEGVSTAALDNIEF